MLCDAKTEQSSRAGLEALFPFGGNYDWILTGHHERPDPIFIPSAKAPIGPCRFGPIRLIPFVSIVTKTMVSPQTMPAMGFSAETAITVFESFDRFQRSYRIDIASWFLLTSVYFSNIRDSNRSIIALTPVSAIELARMTGLSRETVRRKLQVLSHKGLVRKINRAWVVTDQCVNGVRASA